jgi:serine/threonine-protein kinase
MSPEQMSSPSLVDRRADIWSLGITLYELLSDELPFQGANYPQICLRVMTDPVRSLSELGAGVPVELEPILLRCLEKDPDRRYASVAELASALAPFSGSLAGDSVEQVAKLARLPASSVETAPLPDKAANTLPSSEPGQNTESTFKRTISRQSNGPRMSIPTGIIALVGVIVSTWGVTTLVHRSSSSMPSAPAPHAEIASTGPDLLPPQSEPPPAASTPEPAAAPAPTASATVHRKPGPSSGGVAGVQKGASNPPPVSSSCSEPRYIDPQGIVRIRRECIH